MDTREKIIASDHVTAATASGEWVIVAGLFDPLTANSAAYIAGVAALEPQRKVLALVLESGSSHLPAAARATLVAALRSVSLVSVVDDGDLPQESPRVRVITNLTADRQHSREFVQLVLQRQKDGV